MQKVLIFGIVIGGCLFSLLLISKYATSRSQEERPIDSRDLEIMSNSQFSYGRVEFSDGTSVEIQRDQYDLMGAMIESLSPIANSQLGSLGAPDLILFYQSGRDPTRISVCNSGSGLRFSLGSYVYSGGRSDVFNNLVISIIENGAGKNSGNVSVESF